MAEAGGIYRSIKLAAQLFGKPLESLTPEERRRLTQVAARQQEIEALILETPEAASVMLPAASIDASLREIRRRYADDDEYRADLERVDGQRERVAYKRQRIVRRAVRAGMCCNEHVFSLSFYLKPGR